MLSDTEVTSCCLFAVQIVGLRQHVPNQVVTTVWYSIDILKTVGLYW